jgi:hypothetical protein
MENLMDDQREKYLVLSMELLTDKKKVLWME